MQNKLQVDKKPVTSGMPSQPIVALGQFNNKM